MGAPFDGKTYKREVLEPLAKDAARMERLRNVVRALEGSKSELTHMLGPLDLDTLFCVSPTTAEAQLPTHLKTVQRSLNKYENLQSSHLLLELLQRLRDQHDADKPGFWEAARKERKRGEASQLANYGRTIKEECPLGVILEKTAREAADSMGLKSSSDDALKKALAHEQVQVVGDFDVPEVEPQILKVVGDTLQHPGLRTLADVLLFGEEQAPSEVRILDEFTFGVRRTALRAGDIKQAMLRSEKALGEGDKVPAVQRCLTRLESECRSDDDLRDVALAAAAAKTDMLIAAGSPRKTIYERLVDDGIDPFDAARLVTKLVSSASAGRAETLTLQMAEDALVSGRLSEARRIITEVARLGKDADSCNELQTRIGSAEAEKKKLVTKSDKARSAANYDEARGALREALMLDREDEELRTSLDRLPPGSPRSLQIRAAGADATLSWSADPDHSVRYTVVRAVGRVPAHQKDGDVLAKGLAQSSFTDKHPVVARDATYAVFATRDGDAFSAPVTESIRILPEPNGLTASPTVDSVDLSWSTPSKAAGVVIRMRSLDGIVKDFEVSSAGHLAARGLITGRKYHFAASAIYLVGGKREESAPVELDATPRGRAKPVSHFEVRHLTGSIHRAEWNVIRGYDVQLWALPLGVSIEEGLHVTFARLKDDGGRLLPTHSIRESGGKASGRFDPGRMFARVIPVTVDGDGGLAGSSAVAGVLPAPTDVVADRLGDELRLSWTWPDAAQDILVAWKDGGLQRDRRISRARYRAQGGVRLVNADHLSDISLVATAPLGDEIVRSGATAVSLGGPAPPQVFYEIKLKKTVLGKSYTATIDARTENFSGRLPVTIVVKRGSIMPAEAGDAGHALPATLDLSGSASTTISVDLGKHSSPFWVRVFPDTPDVVRLQDPPTVQMRG